MNVTIQEEGIVNGGHLRKGVSLALCAFVLAEVNYPLLQPQSRLALFGLLGLLLLFLPSSMPSNRLSASVRQLLGWALAAVAVPGLSYVIIQTEPAFSRFWIGGAALGDRAGQEVAIDYGVGLLGLILVLEAARRAIGWTLPLLALAFLLYARFGASMPDWLFPHRGYTWTRIVSQTFLHSQGVFGIALKVMFTYVFPFVLFGAFLEATGATGFIVDFSQHLFRRSAGGPAKVAVMSSALMGSLSGSAVANTATTGTFTIPMMRRAGFAPHLAAGVEAAASSGGALMPPIMGAGAYMMLEIVSPPVTYLEILKAALIPALLFYLTLLLVVHLHSRRIGAARITADEAQIQRLSVAQGLLFLLAMAGLIAFLLAGFTPFRAVTLSLGVILLAAPWSKATRLHWRDVVQALSRAAKAGVPLIAAASCVGIVLGVVTLTGVGSKLPAAILPLARDNLIAALFLLMVSTIILGMGLPSAVCYLLMATLIGPMLAKLGLVPLAAHLFIFYFGMMSMVTPPVALAGYTAAAIAKANIMRSSFAAFRFALVGFVLPYAFVLNPSLLLLSEDGGVNLLHILASLPTVLVGVLLLAVGTTGYFSRRTGLWPRFILFPAALVLILLPGLDVMQLATKGIAVLAGGSVLWRNARYVPTPAIAECMTGLLGTQTANGESGV
ncbi:MAG: TRAP transporter fused permease subunit [Phycisphaerales bacterium]|nr:MAG: TRAP transporter fused permease subunit [Phycisphaerales bacterium]